MLKVSKTLHSVKKVLFISLLLLAGCGDAGRSKPVPVAYTQTVKAPAARPAATALATANPTLAYADPLDGVIAMLEASDPQSPSYDEKSAAYAAFPRVLQQLALLDSPKNNAASMLAYALTFPRPDSYLAGQFLIALGPDVDGTTVSQLLASLKDQRPQVRLYALLVIENAGNYATCAIGNIAPLLWDADPQVRSAAALAVSHITGQSLLPDGAQFTPQPLAASPVPADTPPGQISGVARTWWNEQGSKINWHPSYDLCDP